MSLGGRTNSRATQEPIAPALCRSETSSNEISQRRPRAPEWDFLSRRHFARERV
jgi:hypothetical protein